LRLNLSVQEHARLKQHVDQQQQMQLSSKMRMLDALARQVCHVG